MIVPLNSAWSSGLGSRYQPLELLGSASLLPLPSVMPPVRGFPSAGATPAGAAAPPKPLPEMETVTWSVVVLSARFQSVMTRSQWSSAASTMLRMPAALVPKVAEKLSLTCPRLVQMMLMPPTASGPPRASCSACARCSIASLHWGASIRCSCDRAHIKRRDSSASTARPAARRTAAPRVGRLRSPLPSPLVTASHLEPRLNANMGISFAEPDPRDVPAALHEGGFAPRTVFWWCRYGKARAIMRAGARIIPTALEADAFDRQSHKRARPHPHVPHSGGRRVRACINLGGTTAVRTVNERSPGRESRRAPSPRGPS